MLVDEVLRAAVVVGDRRGGQVDAQVVIGSNATSETASGNLKFGGEIPNVERVSRTDSRNWPESQSAIEGTSDAYPGLRRERDSSA